MSAKRIKEVIRLTPATRRYLQERALPGESANRVIRRLLGLPASVPRGK